MDAIFSFVLAALALTGSPGPNTLSLAAVGASFGRMRGLEYMIGINLGMVAVIAVVGSGVAGVVMALPAVAPVITFLAAAYFIYLAWKIATAPPLLENGETQTNSAPRWYVGAGLSLVNPKAYAAMGSLFSGHVLVQGDQIADGLWKFGLLLATISAVNIGWLSFGAGMTHYLRDERLSRIVNVCFAVLLIVSAVYAVT